MNPVAITTKKETRQRTEAGGRSCSGGLANHVIGREKSLLHADVAISNKVNESDP